MSNYQNREVILLKNQEKCEKERLKYTQYARIVSMQFAKSRNENSTVRVLLYPPVLCFVPLIEFQGRTFTAGFHASWVLIWTAGLEMHVFNEVLKCDTLRREISLTAR